MPSNSPPVTPPSSPSSEPEESAASAVDHIFVQLQALQSYGAHYLSAQLNKLKLTIRSLLVWTILGIVALISALGILVTAGVLLCLGIAGLIGRYTTPWIGDLATSLFILGSIAIAGLWVKNRIASTAKKSMIESFERRRSQQRVQFGADIHDRN